MSYHWKESIKRPSSVLAVALGVMLAVGCGSAMTVATDFDRRAEFRGLTGYSLIRPDSGERRAVRPASERRIIRALTRELEAKGYRAVTNEPDFRVGYVVVVESEIDERTMYADQRLGYVSGETETRTYQKGTLVLFVTDASGEKVIWEGRASETFSDPDQETINRRIDEAVARMLARFPPESRS
jgi:hypothetical protein